MCRSILEGKSGPTKSHVPQEYYCEICGGANYRGRREFERHFREWRHQNGMRALGIPNNKNFFEITKVEDAKELWANIQVSISQETTNGAASAFLQQP